ncbi:MAG: hypothetical protein WCC00_03615, partial [Candidatus Aminicenantales bacterium]
AEEGRGVKAIRTAAVLTIVRLFIAALHKFRPSFAGARTIPRGLRKKSIRGSITQAATWLPAERKRRRRDKMLGL